MKKIIFISLYTDLVLAAGGGPLALIPNYINFAILVIVAVFLLKKPIVNAFVAWSDSVKNQFEEAGKKERESQAKLEVIKKKIEESKLEKARILGENENQILAFIKKHKEETQTSIERVKEETIRSVEAQKKGMINDLNKELIDLVVKNAKTMIEKNPEQKDKATKSILGRL